MLDATREFICQVAVGDADGVKEIVPVTLCNSSVSITFNGATAHVPWTEIAEWLKLVAIWLQENES